MYKLTLLLAAFTLTHFLAQSSYGQDEQEPAQHAGHHHAHHHGSSPSACGPMEVFDLEIGGCQPVAMESMPSRQVMLHGYAYFAGVDTGGARGHTAFAVPNMFMADAGASAGNHYWNIEYMGTVERWTFPEYGYPLLFQTGEERDGIPYVDAQHPHSSPIMGLTLSDRITAGDGKTTFKLFAAPRGQSTDGPIAYMHRATGGMVNPDAPLGHHIAQDVGHISESVVGVSFNILGSYAEASVFNGTEPEPYKVDLPIASPNSVAFRLAQELNENTLVMASYAHVRDPEPHTPELTFYNRYSASLYDWRELSRGRQVANTIVFGAITSNLDPVLYSVLEEFAVSLDEERLWGRFELLDRTPSQLLIPNLPDPTQGRWVTAITLGYTHALWKQDMNEVALGASVTEDFVPQEYAAVYGSNPWSGKVFLQVSGMQGWAW